MVDVSRWLVGRQIGRCVIDLTVDAVYDFVKAGLPRFLVEAAAKLGWQDVQQSPINCLDTTKQRCTNHQRVHQYTHMNVGLHTTSALISKLIDLSVGEENAAQFIF